MLTPLRGTVFSTFLPRIMQVVDTEFQPERRALLAHVAGRVLDVGSGGGAYMKYLQGAEQVVALEPVTELHPVIRETAAAQNISKISCIASMDELSPTERFDWIILGNVRKNFIQLDV